MVSHEDSFGNIGKRQLENGPLFNQNSLYYQFASGEERGKEFTIDCNGLTLKIGASVASVNLVVS